MDYVTNINAARNLAFRKGVEMGARWVFVFDGSTLVTSEAWWGLKHSTQTADAHGLSYAVVPMYRVTRASSESWLDGKSTMEHLAPHLYRAEPQLALRSDAPRLFDEQRLFDFRMHHHKYLKTNEKG